MPPLREHFESTGNWLFRRRSYVPFILLVPLFGEMLHFEWPLRSHALQFKWEICCIAVSIFGLIIRAVTIGHVPARTSGRNTKHQVAATLNVTGIYSIVRHPLYIGNFFIWLGFAMFCLDWRLLLIFMLGFWLYYERIIFAEEEFLRRKFPKAFLAWATVTPAIIPRFSGWKPSSLTFCWKTMVRREYRGPLGVAAMFFMLHTAGDLIVQRRLVLESVYLVGLLACFVMFVTVRWFAKRTTVLHVAGR